MNKKIFFPLLLILSTAFLVYLPALKNQFIWDDFYLVVGNKTIESFHNTAVAFKTHLFRDVGGSNFYRPIQTISFMADYLVWKLNPFGYHLTNLVFHLLTVVVVYFLVRRIFNPEIGILTGLIFAVHPINTEAVAYISGRADPISSFFFLAALLSYIKFRTGRNRFLFFISLLFFALSLLTKEAVLIFPLILILYDALILRQVSVNIKSAKLYGPYFLIVLAYIFLRFFVLGFPIGLMEHIPLKLFIINTPKLLISYLWLLFFPIDLHMERLEPLIKSPLDPQAIVSLITITSIVWLSLLMYRRSKPIFFCISFFFITLLPMLNILTINAMMAEHWVYLSSIGAYAIVSSGVVKVIDLRKSILKQGPLGKLISLVFIGFISFFSIRAVFRNIEWGRPFEFYKNLVRQSPGSSRAHLNLGSFYMSRKDYKKARQELQAGRELDPENPFSYQAFGFLDFMEDKKDEAAKEWKAGLGIAPFYRPTRRFMNLYLHAEDKRFKKLMRAVGINPKNIMANYRLSKVYLENGLYLEAADRLERILAIEPDHIHAIFNKAWLYSKLGLYTRAIAEYEKVMALTPDAPDIYENMGFCYDALNRRKEAEKMRQKAKGLKKK